MGKMSRKSFVASNRRREVAALYLQGWAQTEISEKLKIAQSTISLDLRRIYAAWRESSVMDFNTRQIVELQKLDHLEREAWAAWERSQMPSQQARLKGGKPEQDAVRVVKNQIGDPRFLEQVHKCIASRPALLGLDGPLRIEATQVAPPPMTTEERRAEFLAIIDRVRQRAIAAESSQLPPLEAENRVE
jgi:hypothetical protein